MTFDDEVNQVNLTLTSAAIAILDEESEKQGISRDTLMQNLILALREESNAVESVDSVVPEHAKNRILREYGEKLQRVIELDKGSGQTVAIYIQPPKVWLYFNKSGQSEVVLGEPGYPEDCLEMTKGEEIWCYTNLDAYLDGCKIFADMIKIGQQLIASEASPNQN